MSENVPNHSENVSNLGILTSKLQSFGSRYNPSNSMLAIANLNQLKAQGETILDTITTAEINARSVQSAHTAIFNDFDTLVTRISNTLNVCGAPATTITQGQSIIRELRGKRASALLTAEELAAEKEKGNDVRQITIHNSTMNEKTNNFGKLIQFLSTVQQYAPNEPELTIPSLTNKLNEMKSLFNALTEANTTLEVARTNRKKIMYSEETGLVNVAQSAKQYVKAAFGANSDEYNQVKGIRFSNKG